MCVKTGKGNSTLADLTLVFDATAAPQKTPPHRVRGKSETHDLHVRANIVVPWSSGPQEMGGGPNDPAIRTTEGRLDGTGNTQKLSAKADISLTPCGVKYCTKQQTTASLVRSRPYCVGGTTPAVSFALHLRHASSYPGVISTTAREEDRTLLRPKLTGPYGDSNHRGVTVERMAKLGIKTKPRVAEVIPYVDSKE
jgi:hypothetical protein